jgi:signal transduction histidine kinase/CheY-like chemotaxis protein
MRESNTNKDFMKVAKIPENENDRLKALREYEILDTLPEMDFDDFTKVASHICGTPIALISLVDESRQWFKSSVGLDAPQTPRDLAFCSHAILQEEVFVVPDSFEDERFKDNPLATGAPDVRFYAGAPLKTPSGHKIGTLCVIDSSPRELNDDQIEALKALARQVVNQLELRLSKKKAEKVLAQKTSFFANMSHEIRTPLNGVIGFTGLLLDQKLSKEAYNNVQNIKECSESLLMIINDILDISKIEAGKLSVEDIPYNLEKAVKASMLVFKTVVDQKDIEINYNISKDIPEVINGDPLRIRQILLNLIGNAVKFTHTGKVIIDVSSNIVETQDNFDLEIKVIDTGIGIPKDSIQNIFQSFEQVDSTTTRNYGGTGLGLTICSKLVELMGGKMWVESEVNKGSTFGFSVLASASNEEIATIDINDPKPLLEISKNENNLKILIAEDNKLNQTFVRSLLKKLGYTDIVIVENGQKAIEAVQDQDYDIIFMDIQMPIMDGYEATKIIKNELNCKTQIVGLSANVFKEDKEKALELGMSDYLEKPINTEHLSRILNDSNKSKI